MTLNNNKKSGYKEKKHPLVSVPHSVTIARQANTRLKTSFTAIRLALSQQDNDAKIHTHASGRVWRKKDQSCHPPKGKSHSIEKQYIGDLRVYERI